ncbi:MAG TPA: alginate lyase family protein, partial [Thermoleophilia bacterium]|nr:alginate lyase family protein [Thermoleophilia bacterium]
LLAQAFRLSGDRRYLSTLNSWYADWVTSNPPNQGPNWKCGQETSLRLLNALLTWELLAPDALPPRFLFEFVRQHCRRIEATLLYGIAQDNNHGVSEAAGLFVGGGWLRRYSAESRPARRWERKGRRTLEERVEKLVLEDGTFSQYSTNYHRLLLDLLSLAEHFRRRFGAAAFSALFYRRTCLATDWLFEFTDEISGDAPNLGANDGALLFDLSHLGYREFRPSIQRASAFFAERLIYSRGEWDGAWRWLLPEGELKWKAQTRASRLFPFGGYAILHHPTLDSWVMLRLPVFRFRPSHADILHLDLWHRGLNLLIDGGSYSYVAGEPWQSYFPGVGSHNTIQFDDDQPMPRIGRFLWGSWPQAESVEGIRRSGRLVGAVASYTDFRGRAHTRRVMATNAGWEVVDLAEGHTEALRLRWHLSPVGWRLEGSTLRSGSAAVELEASQRGSRLSLSSAHDSRYYASRRRIPVLEFGLPSDGRTAVRTEVHL